MLVMIAFFSSFLLAWICANCLKVDRNYEKVVGKIIDFEKTSNDYVNYISPVISYTIDNVKYRCVIYLLICEDNPVNRQLYYNKDQLLYYDKRNPNRVRIKKNSQNTTGLVFTILFFLFFLIMIIFM